MVVNKYKIREQNESLILKGIIDHKNISRAELAVLTGLNKASVSSITKTLLDDGLIFETGIGNASTLGGRKPILLQFNPKAALILSFDIGVDYLKGTLAYLDGEAVVTIQKKRIVVSSETVIALLQQSIKELTVKTDSLIVGMCVAVHGVVNQNEIVFTPYYDLDTIDLHQKLSDHFEFPIFIENEANLAALGEYVFSLDSKTLVSLSIHSGIGAGIVDGGILRKGHFGEAGEIGHSILYPNGKKCPCGNRGCLEQYASNSVLYENLASIKGLEYVDSTIVQKLVESDDEKTAAALADNAFLLSIGINNILTVYDPEVVVINSSIYRNNPALLSMITTHLTSRFARNVQIQNSKLGSQATLFGGIALCCQNFLNIKELKLYSN
ncbi:MarR family transcriptional regulator [Enterococcus silesiacus]|uniref:MarR family transcriptional regulator n=1 Tax=Enterococcus silesiacus TaxID=332949 RepID=A0ABN4J8H3_9ENTE|nr:ROK family transcriptional regulator [Enterococcus silesiacus]ALS01843.1 MarR family transcriptional regulator [Enterococcus silesiacus]